MYISKVRINNFRSLRDICVNLRNTNILIGPNNSGKTSFLEAINYAIGWKSVTPQEDDFFIADPEQLDPKKAEPIKIILDFYEGYIDEERFSSSIDQTFDGIIQYDENLVKDDDEPIKFIRLKYQYGYVKESGKFVESREFLDGNDKSIIGRNTGVRREHTSFFPFFYLEALRDIKKEIRTRSSFWGKIKTSIDYSDKETEINKLISSLDEVLVKSEPRLNDLIRRLKEIQNTVKISDEEDSLFLQAFSNRSWELLDGLNLYLKTANSNISLPIDKHGMGTQNIATLIIFNVYLEVLLPELIENPETTPIIGIEEPEAHVYPHSQRAMFEQLVKMRGQKIISTHSPYIVDQADIYDYILFRNLNGETTVRRIPEFKTDFSFKYGLPKIAYEKQAYFGRDDIHSLRRYIQFKNTELLFSSVFLMFEGDSEKVFFELLAPAFLGSSLGRLGVSIISCDGQAYSNFLKIARKEALHIPWLIFSDGESETMENVRKAVLSNGFSGNDFDTKIVFLPEGDDFESFYIDWLGEDVLYEIISYKYGDKALEFFQKEQVKNTQSRAERDSQKKCENCGVSINGIKVSENVELVGKNLINRFIDSRGKTIFGEHIAEYVLSHHVILPYEIHEILNKIRSI